MERIKRMGMTIDSAVDEKGHTLLHLAASRGATEIVRALIGLGANVNTTDKDGLTPLHVAVTGRERIEAVQAILDAGAQIDAAGGALKQTPLHVAASYGEEDIVDALLKRGARIDAVDEDDRTPLHWAAGFGKSDMVKALVDKGARTDLCDYRGMTAETAARGMGFREVAEFLRTAPSKKVKASGR